VQLHDLQQGGRAVPRRHQDACEVLAAGLLSDGCCVLELGEQEQQAVQVLNNAFSAFQRQPAAAKDVWRPAPGSDRAGYYRLDGRELLELQPPDWALGCLEPRLAAGALQVRAGEQWCAVMCCAVARLRRSVPMHQT
jgi:hypothetical protein